MYSNMGSVKILGSWLLLCFACMTCPIVAISDLSGLDSMRCMTRIRYSTRTLVTARSTVMKLTSRQVHDVARTDDVRCLLCGKGTRTKVALIQRAFLFSFISQLQPTERKPPRMQIRKASKFLIPSVPSGCGTDASLRLIRCTWDLHLIVEMGGPPRHQFSGEWNNTVSLFIAW